MPSLTTLANVRQRFEGLDEATDAALQSLIDAAEAMCAQFLWGRNELGVVTRTYRINSRDSVDPQVLHLPDRPVDSVTSVKENDETVTDYTLEANDAILRRNENATWLDQRGAYVVVADVGFSSLDAAQQEAVYQTIAALWERGHIAGLPHAAVVEAEQGDDSTSPPRRARSLLSGWVTWGQHVG